MLNRKRQDSFSCSQCNRKFGRKDHLNRHLHRHTGNKSLRCTICTAVFSRKDALLRHSLVH
ncbi:hypothetical protein COCVIDRAFT_116001, partial [Bipolaris victoriae FI3]